MGKERKVDWQKRHERYKIEKQREIKSLRESYVDACGELSACRDKLDAKKAKKGQWTIDVKYQTKSSGQDHDYVKALVEAGCWFIEGNKEGGKSQTVINTQVITSDDFESAKKTVIALMDAGVWFFKLDKKGGV